MLKGLSPLLSPDLLKILCEMGHGDTIVISDAHFPSHTLGPQVLRMDGVAAPDLLRAIMPVWEFDSYVDAPFAMMQAVPGDTLDMDYVRLCAGIAGREPAFIERFAFYEKAKSAYAVVHTGETRKYGNLLLQKGVIPV